MKRAPLDEFLRDPRGLYLAGKSWLYWCVEAGDVFGFTLWGRPDEAEMRALVTALKVELTDGVRPHASVVDVRRVTSVDLAAFEVLHGYVKDYGEPLSRRVTRLALARPGGLAGAVTSGFYAVVKSPYPTQLFETLEDACAWVSAPPGLAARLDALFAEASGVDPLVGQLRALLAERGSRVPAGDAAKALGLSQRTMQRKLADAGTTFADETNRVRLAEAQRRMLDSDAPLTSIALDAGFPSLQHFSTFFRKLTGVAPSDWRKRARSGEG